MELLAVIGIIIILAGLAIPAVMIAQQKSRITAAKADMAAILTALKGVEGTYHKMVSGSSFNGKNASKYPTSSSTESILLGGTAASDAYDAFIAELTNPTNGKLSSLNINKRKIKFLDPKTEFDASKDYDHADNIESLWRDPWGNRYVILINTDFSDQISNPKDNSKKLSAKAVIYSFGPDGKDNSGKNVIDDDDAGDDICSWK